MLENTERASKNGESRGTGTIHKTQTDKTKTQHNFCWTPLYANKHNI